MRRWLETGGTGSERWVRPLRLGMTTKDVMDLTFRIFTEGDVPDAEIAERYGLSDRQVNRYRSILAEKSWTLSSLSSMAEFVCAELEKVAEEERLEIDAAKARRQQTLSNLAEAFRMWNNQPDDLISALDGQTIDPSTRRRQPRRCRQSAAGDRAS
jgi:hypothetical protein